MNRLRSLIYIIEGDLNARYTSTLLGPFWMLISFSVLCSGLALIWSQIYSQNISDTLPYFCVGLALWIYLSSCIAQGTDHLINNRDIIINNTYNPFFITLTVLTQNLVNLAFNSIYILIVFSIFINKINILGLFTSLFFLVIVTIQVFLIGHLLGFIGAKYRDLQHIINTIIQPLFFITPVVFRPDTLTSMKFIIFLNPFAHYIIAIRNPILGEAIPNESIIFVFTGLFLSFTLFRWIRKRYLSKLVYWVM